MMSSEKPGLYVHVPFCTAKCRYCAFYSVPVRDQDVNTLIDSLIREIDLYPIPYGQIKTIYIGGGSPSCIANNELYRLINAINARTGTVHEFTIEVNPAQIEGSTLEHIRGLGVNRLSIGAQSFNQAELDFLGRPYSPHTVRELLRQARAAGFANISLDLIFALPGQTAAALQHSLDSVIALAPEHVSAYSLTYEQNTPLYHDLQQGTVMPLDEESDRQLYYRVIDVLASAGILQYEISNFARMGFECKHNMIYWANEPYIGIGPGAASFYHGTRTSNTTDIADYQTKISSNVFARAETETLNPLDFACQTAVLNLRRASGINISEYHQLTNFDIYSLFGEAIRQLEQQGLLHVTEQNICLTREALPIADSILCEFADTDL